MLTKRREFYYLRGAMFEAVIGFSWRRRRRKFELRSMGFTGQIEADEILPRFLEIGLEFLKSKELTRIFAVIPRQMDSVGICQVYELGRQLEQIEVRGRHRVATGTFVWIQRR